MQSSSAISLLTPGITSASGQLWYDLGAGTGVFTVALAELLDSQNKQGELEIIAVDVDVKALKTIPSSVGKVRITREVGDFGSYPFESNAADGILLANALHFVRDKLQLMKKFRDAIKDTGTLLIVEYEMSTPNTWVPYPISFDELQKLGTKAGFSSTTKLATVESKYQRGGIYSATLRP